MINSELALIGAPVESSKSDEYHNNFLKKIGLQERYSKYCVPPEELENFMKDAKQSSMLGLSVTMPLKEIIIPFLDEIDETAKNIGAVNTVKFNNGLAKGFNTDCQGALLALQSTCNASIDGQKAIIIGAGGAAKAIAWGLKQAGAKVAITNRTTQKAILLAEQLNVEFFPFEELKKQIEAECEVLINATSVGMFDKKEIIKSDCIPNKTIVFDCISRPKNDWLKSLSIAGNKTVSGQIFWINQAIEQYKIWFNNSLDLSKASALFN